jgi:DNA repair exonuclease SbcCD nuclease subunit
LSVSGLFIGDVHAADGPPSSRTQDYCNDILAKLEETVTMANELGVDFVLFAGDIFHLKAASRISHRLVQRISEILLSYAVPVYILVGNHDITDGSLDSIQKQPIGNLGLVDNVTLLLWEPVEVCGGITLHPVPGVNGVTLDDFKIKKTTGFDILVAHQSIVPDISLENEMIKDILIDAKDVVEISGADLILYGHQHRCDGIYDVSGKTLCNLGSICRLTVADYDLKKVPMVLHFTINEDMTSDLDAIHLKSVKNVDEAYFLSEVIEAKDHKKDIEETIKKLKETHINSFSLEGVISEIEIRTDIDAPVRQKSLDLLEEVR